MTERSGPTWAAPSWPVVRRYEGLHLHQVRMPLGGVGAGCVSLGGRGQLVDWEVQNRPAKGFTPLGCFLAVRVDDGERTWTRLLERELLPTELAGAHGSPAPQAGLPRFREASFEAAFPLGAVELSDPDLPVRARIEAFSPFVPGDSDASGYPAAVLRVRLRSTGDRPIRVSLLASLAHPAGEDPAHPGEGNRFERLDTEGSTLLLGTPGPSGADAAGRGTVALGLLGATASSHRLSWAEPAWNGGLRDLWDDFAEDGEVDPGRGSDSGHPATAVGCLVTRTELAPGAEDAVTWGIGWHFPHRRGWRVDGGTSDDVVGNHYATVHEDAGAALLHLASRLPDLERRTVAFVESVTGLGMPVPLQDAALSNLAVLVSPTCFRIADGTFLAWEGCHDDHGSCHGSCTHVWNYQYALEDLFPGLAWTMREVELVHSLDERGLMSFRAGLPLQEKGTEWRTAAADGQMGSLVRLLRTWRRDPDDERLRRSWPGARRAMEVAWVDGGWDADQDGMMEGCQHTTMDVEWYGPQGVGQSWYLAALASCAVLARQVGDDEFAARCEAIRREGARRTDAELFDGEYYPQRVVPPGRHGRVAEGLRIRFDDEGTWAGTDDLEHPDLQLGDGCASDQLVGHSMALLAGVDTGLDPGNVAAAWRSVLRYNHRDGFHDHDNPMRSYAVGDERGLLVCSFPRGPRPPRPAPYADEVWTGFEYSAAVGLLLDGDQAAAEQVVRDVRDRYDGLRRNPFDEVECGHHYVRSMASWGLVEAWRARTGEGATVLRNRLLGPLDDVRAV